MVSEQLQNARTFEAQYLPRIDGAERPAFHVTGGVGWINDPNGFSCYKGEYHLFYQYHPYSTSWGPMHWGHVKTRDFIRWERLPVALAPDTDCDAGGCYSGSALEMPDGQQLLLYTGVQKVRGENGLLHDVQTQCAAIGDGVNYKKYAQNPVLTAKDLPAGGSAVDFRDPKIWWDQEDGCYYMVVGNRASDSSGAVLLYQGKNGLDWSFVCVLDASHNEYGAMWECPDFFPLGGRQVLLVSPQEMEPDGLEFHAGEGTVCLIGEYHKANHTFIRQKAQAIDYGIDFYAPQTLETPDGRRVMIAWMQNWASANSQPVGVRFFGAMTLPRELAVRDGRLIQNPVRELEQYHGNRVVYEKILISQQRSFPDISGRILDVTVKIRPHTEEGYDWFKINLAASREHFTTVCYSPRSNVIRVDRSKSGFQHDIVHVREFAVRPQNGNLKLRIILDRTSMELFVNDGEQAATFNLYTSEDSDAITFEAKDSVIMDIEKYDLTGFDMEENRQ